MTHTITAEQRQEMLRQIGRVNVLSISGGRIHALPDGLALPVSAGYSVRVRLTAADDYTVERVFIRSGKVHSHGLRERVYCDQVGELAYRAGMFRSYSDAEW